MGFGGWADGIAKRNEDSYEKGDSITQNAFIQKLIKDNTELQNIVAEQLVEIEELKTELEKMRNQKTAVPTPNVPNFNWPWHPINTKWTCGPSEPEPTTTAGSSRNER